MNLMSKPRERSSASPTTVKRNGKATPAPTVPPQTAVPRPASNDRNRWRTYWQAQGQPWRTEPEIEPKRQAELAQRRAIVPDIEKGIYPFKSMKLSRADVEWLLATHENGRGPVDWSDEHQREREGLDLRAADLHGVNLRELPLARLRGGLTMFEWLTTTEEGRVTAAPSMQEIKLFEADLQGALLVGANLQGASLSWANLQKADLRRANLQKANLEETNLQKVYLTGADLQEAHLEQEDFFYFADSTPQWLNLAGANLQKADLQGANFQKANLQGADLQKADLRKAWLEKTSLEDAVLSDESFSGPLIADVQWGDTNLAVVDWSKVTMLGDECEAYQKRDDVLDELTGRTKETRLGRYEKAVRANRQLAVTLQAQGLNEDAARFNYRAQNLQKSFLWLQVAQGGVKFRQRVKLLGAWLFSWFLFLLAGYGYRPSRSFLAYLLVISGFAAAYYLLGYTVGPELSPLGALVFSMTSFHGRGFFPGNNISLDDPLTVLAALEALVGLILEITFIATLTQRFFNR